MLRTTLVALFALVSTPLFAAPLPGITLLGKGLIPGNAIDKSGLTGVICQA